MDFDPDTIATLKSLSARHSELAARYAETPTTQVSSLRIMERKLTNLQRAIAAEVADLFDTETEEVQ